MLFRSVSQSRYGVQKRYLLACSMAKRKNISFEEKFLLVGEKFKSMITELIPEETLVNSGKNPEDTQLILEESTQSKVKERKVKESKVCIEIQEENPHTFLPVFYFQVIGQDIPIPFFELCESYIKGGMEEVVASQAILKGVGKDKPDSYIKSILENWFKQKKFKLSDVISNSTNKQNAKINSAEEDIDKYFESEEWWKDDSTTGNSN